MIKLPTITPSRYTGDPLGHVLNQAGHGLIGAGLMAFLPTALWSVAVIAVAYILLIEWPQLRDADEEWVRIDSFEDALHVTMGALLAWTGAAWVAVGWAFALGVGAWRRA